MSARHALPPARDHARDYLAQQKAAPRAGVPGGDPQLRRLPGAGGRSSISARERVNARVAATSRTTTPGLVGLCLQSRRQGRPGDRHTACGRSRSDDNVVLENLTACGPGSARRRSRRQPQEAFGEELCLRRRGRSHERRADHWQSKAPPRARRSRGEGRDPGLLDRCTTSRPGASRFSHDPLAELPPPAGAHRGPATRNAPFLRAGVVHPAHDAWRATRRGSGRGGRRARCPSESTARRSYHGLDGAGHGHGGAQRRPHDPAPCSTPVQGARGRLRARDPD